MLHIFRNRMLGSKGSMVPKLWTLVASIFMSTGWGLAQEIYQVEELSLDKRAIGLGLSSILQDEAGFIWLGSFGSGLTRYDGHELLNFTRDRRESTTIGTADPTSLWEDSQGRIWAGSTSGISIFHPNRESFSNLVTDVGGWTWTYAEEDSLRFWAAINNELYSISDVEGEWLLQKYSSGSDRVGLISTDRSVMLNAPNGDVWVSTAEGVHQYHPHGGRFQHFPKPTGLDGAILKAIAGNDGRFWLATESSGLWSFDPGSFEYAPYPMDLQNKIDCSEVTRFFESNGDYLWLALGDQDIVKLQLATGDIIHPVSASGQSIHPVLGVTTPFLEDRHGNIWVGALKPIIARKTDPAIERLLHQQGEANSLSSNAVKGLAVDHQSNLWVGTDGAGLNFLNRRTNEWRHLQAPSLVNNKVVWVMCDDDGDILTSHYPTGISKVDPSTNGVEQLAVPGEHLFVRQVLQRSDGEYWVNGNGGLSPMFQRIEQPDGVWGWNAVLDSQDRIWMAAEDNGVYVIDTGSNVAHKKLDISAFNILVAKNGMVWILTPHDGIAAFDPENGTTRYLRDTHDLPIECAGIMEDRDGNLWIGSDEGIIVYYPDRDEFMIVADFENKEPFYFRPYDMDEEGRIYFGGAGVTIIDPKKLRGPSSLRAPKFSELQLANVHARPGSESVLTGALHEANRITLGPDQNVFTLSFASLDFQLPAKRYRFRLHGFEEDWRYGGIDNYSTFTNLDHGSYEFEVQTGFSWGQWSESSLLNIKVLPPWWETRWAYGIYVVTLIAALLFARKQILDRERLKNRAELDRVELEKVREIDELKTQFFTNMSHEFRTPLTLILGPLKKMREGNFKGDRTAILDIMFRNASRLLNLINQLLDLSKLDAGKLSLKAGRADLVRFCKRIAGNYESYAEGRGIHFQVNHREAELEVWIDADKMEKVLHNLLSNAFKFTPDKGEVLINVGNQDGGWVEIEVADNGPGIPLEEQHKVFDRFHQVDATITREQEGTGIGMALVKELVDLHHGEIRIESAAGEGTKFIVMLPSDDRFLEQDERSHGSGEATNVSISPMEMATGGVTVLPATQEDKKTVLIVEDNADMRVFIRMSLTEDYNTQEAHHGKEGLSMALDSQPDLIISDVMMPQMDGIMLCEKLKTDERTSHIPVMLLTAKADRESRLVGLETGADDYLSKPFDEEELLLLIRNRIAQRERLQEKFRSTPDIGPKEVAVNSVDQQFLERVIAVIEDHMDESELSMEWLAEEVGMSLRQMNRKLSAMTGLASSLFVRSIRLKRAAQLLAQNADNVSQIAYTVGFSNPSYFTRSFKEEFGVSPKQYAEDVRVQRS